MKCEFNNKLEAIYGINYGLNRSQNIIKQAENEQEQPFFDEIYRIFLSKVPDELSNEVRRLGDYHRVAEYVLDPQNQLPDLSAFDDFYLKNSELESKIISDIQSSENLQRLKLDELKEFLGIDSASDINVILSMFINEGFGVFNGNSNIILGVQYNPELSKYDISPKIASEIFRDLSFPYVQMLMKREKISVPHGNEEYADELLARVLEIVFASRVFGDEYIEPALQEQDKHNLIQTRIFLSSYLENKDKITNLQDYVDLLLANELLAKV